MDRGIANVIVSQIKRGEWRSEEIRSLSADLDDDDEIIVAAARGIKERPLRAALYAVMACRYIGGMCEPDMERTLKVWQKRALAAAA